MQQRDFPSSCLVDPEHLKKEGLTVAGHSAHYLSLEPAVDVVEIPSVRRGTNYDVIGFDAVLGSQMASAG